jgi:hypothetical protein
MLRRTKRLAPKPYMRSFTLLLFMIFFAFAYSQKIPLYTKLDSLKDVQRKNLTDLRARHIPDKFLDSTQGQYVDITDSIRDLAHDFADSIIEHMDRYSHFELGLDIASNQYYYGRRGAATGTVGTPSLKYIHKIGLYVMFDADIYSLKYSIMRRIRLGKQDTVTGQKTEPDLVFTAGFARTFFDMWDVELYYDHTIIFYGTDKNLLSNTLDLNSGFDFWNYITAKVEYQFVFGGASSDASKKKLSHILLLNLYKDFKIYRLPGSAILSIGPEIQSNVGNDNLARSRVIARNRHGGLEVPELYDNFFGLLDIEGAINIDYRIKNLDINFTPHIALPFNEIPANLPQSVSQSAQLAQYRQNQMQAPIFYATVGIKYYFKFWKERHKKSKLI